MVRRASSPLKAPFSTVLIMLWERFLQTSTCQRKRQKNNEWVRDMKRWTGDKKERPQNSSTTATAAGNSNTEKKKTKKKKKKKKKEKKKKKKKKKKTETWSLMAGQFLFFLVYFSSFFVCCPRSLSCKLQWECLHTRWVRACSLLSSALWFIYIIYTQLYRHYWSLILIVL